MTPVRTDAELVTAIEAMYRIRAVESPPDARGQRTIWHRANRNAELVSTVDAEGRVIRQELMLFDDLLIWERGGGLKTGAIIATPGARAATPSESMELDSSVVHERIARMNRGLTAYAGEDRFIAHMRELISPMQSVAAVSEQITRPSNVVLQEIEDSKPASAKPSGPPIVALAIGVGLMLVAVALFFIFWK